MKKNCIGMEHIPSEGICKESWEGGGITDSAFHERYNAGYELAHHCLDSEDDDIFHYVFHAKGGKLLDICELCGKEFSLDPEALRATEDRQMDIRIAPETRNFLLPAILSPEGRAAGYDLQIAGTKASLATRARK